jgi:spermidine/putrescine transport system ATP-binding protein
MSEGRVLQLGSPAAIYERPATRFVADFIGQTNFLDVDVLGSQFGVTTVELPGSGRLWVQTPDEFAPAGRMTLAVRPEKLSLLDDMPSDDMPDWSRVTGRLVEIIYVGTHTQYVLRLPGDQMLTIHRQNRANGEVEHAIGEQIEAVFYPMSAALLAD